jgi:hypothetical protein
VETWARLFAAAGADQYRSQIKSWMKPSEARSPRPFYGRGDSPDFPVMRMRQGTMLST